MFAVLSLRPEDRKTLRPKERFQSQFYRVAVEEIDRITQRELVTGLSLPLARSKLLIGGLEILTRHVEESHRVDVSWFLPALHILPFLESESMTQSLLRPLKDSAIVGLTLPHRGLSSLQHAKRVSSRFTRFTG